MSEKLKEIAMAILALGVILGMMWGIFWGLGQMFPSVLEQTINHYNEAVELCGGDMNVEEHNYTNGTTDFDCYTYVEKE